MTTQKRVSMMIKRLRTDRAMSQGALARKAGISREYIARLEGGHHDPSLSTLLKLAKALKVKVEELLE